MSQTRNKNIVALIAAITFALGVAFAQPQPSPASPSAPSIACKKAKIGGKRKCIAAGQFCSRQYERDYNKYGYSCSKRDKNGRYHLKKI